MNSFIHRISAYSLKISAIILIASAVIITSCKKESASEFPHTKDRLSFKIAEYSKESDLWQNAHHTKAAGKAAPHTKSVVAMHGESALDTLFIHTSVSNGIEIGKGKDKEPATKSKPIDSGDFHDSFGIFASTYFGKWNESVMLDYMYNVAVTKSSGWTTDYLWPKVSDGKIRFFAYAPYNAKGVSFPGGKLYGRPLLQYTVPQSVEEQVDLLIAETQEFECSAAVPVSLPFKHIMSAIKFVVGNDVISSTIKSVSIKGVFNSGSCKIEDTPVWTLEATKSDYSQNVDKTIDGTVGEAVTSPEQTFMMLPQTLPAGATIEIVYNDGVDRILRADISSKRWEMGMTYIYKITNTNILWESVLEISDEMHVPCGGGEVSFNIYSYREDEYGRMEPLPWSSEFSTDGGETWSSSAPDWLKGFPTNGNGSLDVAYYDNIIVVANTDGETTFDDMLKRAEPVTGNYNLSNSTGGPLIENTANCYIVNAPGRYLVPLVYGNGIKNRVTNFEAYRSTAGGSNILGTFLNHLGNEITSPVIHENENCEPGGAILLWQDAEDLITDVNLSQDKTALVFNVKRETIKQGNAVVAVFDTDGIVMWSWHIWVTPYIPNLDADVDNIMRDKVVTNRSNLKYTMMPFNIGWCCTKASIFSQRTVLVRIAQKGTKNTKSALLKYVQEGGIDKDSESLRVGNCTYYQWGRKDPMLPAIGSNTKTWYDNMGYAHTEISTYDFGSAIKTCIGNQISSPHTMNSSTIQDGYYNLWSSSNNKGSGTEKKVVKTIYDPSPVGYCVPPPAAYNGFSFFGKQIYMLENLNVDGEFSNGFNFYCNKMNTDKTKDPYGGVITFPAVGYRSSSAGNVVYAGCSGLYWTAIPLSYLSESYSLGFTSSSVTPAGECHNEFALPVRPVREL